MKRLLCAGTAWVGLAGLGLPAAHASSGEYAELVRQVSPSVVTVLVTEKRQGAGQRAVERAAANSDRGGINTILRRLLAGPEADPDQHGEGALGSGFIIRADGLIVTNRHVIVDARSVQVKLPDGKQVPAQVIGADAATDIALIKISAGTLPALQLGSSSDL